MTTATTPTLTPAQWRTLRAIIDDYPHHLHAGVIVALARRGLVTVDDGGVAATPQGHAAYRNDYRT